MTTTAVALPSPQVKPAPLAFKVITPRNSVREMSALKAGMQGLVLDKDHPIALEMAGTAAEQMWIIRATTAESLDHSVRQIRARYPQVAFVPLAESEDPFRVETGEAVSVVELLPGAASYIPMLSWDEKTLDKEGTDPLLGVLAAIERLPEDLRAITQVAVIPAPVNWAGATGSRKAVEHPLDHEREQKRAEMYAGREKGFSTPAIVGMVLILLGLYLGRLLHVTVAPWVLQAAGSLLHGRPPALSDTQKFQFYGGAALLFGSVFTLYVIYDQVRKRLKTRTTLYDQRLVSQRTGQIAYRVRVRLYVVGRGPNLDLARYCQLALHLPLPGTPRGVPLLLKALVRSAWRVVRKELAWRRSQRERRNAVLLRMVAAYRQFHRGSGGYFVPHRLSGRAALRLVSRLRGWRSFRHGWERGLPRSRHFASMEELSTMWHLLQALDLPNVALVATRSARTLLIPPDIAVLARGAPVIGYSRHGEHAIPFSFTKEWLRLHALVLGKSGEGKSSFLLHIAQAAAQEGGMVFIDPPGDNIPHVLRLIPAHRQDDVVVIDLSDPLYSVGLNPLDVTLGRGRDKAIADLLETLSHIWLRSWGSRMENSFEFALRTAWEANRYLVESDKQNGPQRQYTLLDILPLYTSESFCHSLLQYIKDPYVHRWWREFYEPLPLYMKRDIINPVATKVAKFESEIARRIVGQPVSTINLTQIIREKKILLVRLAKGTVGADAAPLLGATILGLLSVCLEEQGALDEKNRALFPILIDEFQVLEGVDWSMLAQLRKYGATFFLATQSLEYLKQLEAVLLPTVLANVRQIYSFNLSAQDAWTIHKELGVEAEDIINLDSHMCYVKLKSGEQRRPTFSLQIETPPVGSVALAEAIRGDSQQQYATPATVVDKWLRESVVRQRIATPEIVTIEADPDGVTAAPDLSVPQLPPGRQNGQETQSKGGNAHAPRVRGQGGKGGQKDTRTPKDHKPQVATTPTGEPRSRPILFASRSEGEHGRRQGKKE